MLTISKPLSSGQAQNYHQKEFTSKEQNYWSQSGEIAGEWQGRLAERFGLGGAVSAEDFARLSQGQHPQDGEQLVRQRASYEYQDRDGKGIKTMEHRAGWDATFSAPKSVSLTALVGGDDRVREAHREAVRVALDELERYTQARIGGNHPPETTGKFAAAKFEHDTARPVDGYAAPQLHTHAVIFNLTVLQEFRMGKLASAWETIRGRNPKQAVIENLRHFKQLVETGEIPRTEGQPHGPRGVIGGMKESVYSEKIAKPPGVERKVS